LALFYVFQDILTRKTLGCGVKWGNLYYLELKTTGEGQYNKVCFATKGDWTLSEVWLRHKRLGYLSFSYLKKLKPNLFTALQNLDFQCTTCELAKSHRKPYFSSSNKCSKPFMVIHSDIWGPATISSISKARYFITFIDECTRMTWVSLLHKKVMAVLLFRNSSTW
jgi:hypothetical protein